MLVFSDGALAGRHFALAARDVLDAGRHDEGAIVGVFLMLGAHVGEFLDVHRGVASESGSDVLFEVALEQIVGVAVLEFRGRRQFIHLGLRRGLVVLLRSRGVPVDGSSVRVGGGGRGRRGMTGAAAASNEPGGLGGPVLRGRRGGPGGGRRDGGATAQDRGVFHRDGRVGGAARSRDDGRRRIPAVEETGGGGLVLLFRHERAASRAGVERRGGGYEEREDEDNDELHGVNRGKDDGTG